MGYCYQGRMLVCDFCGHVGGVKKIRCTYGYCQSPAMCPNCRQKEMKGFRANCKIHCKKGHLEFMARQLQETTLLDAGNWVRCSASSVDVENKSMIHVLFKNKNGENKGYYMSKEVYDSFDLLAIVTPEMYMTKGELLSAPNSYEYGNTTKKVNWTPVTVLKI